MCARPRPARPRAVAVAVAVGERFERRCTALHCTALTAFDTRCSLTEFCFEQMRRKRPHSLRDSSSEDGSESSSETASTESSDPTTWLATARELRARIDALLEARARLHKPLQTAAKLPHAPLYRAFCESSPETQDLCVQSSTAARRVLELWLREAAGQQAQQAPASSQALEASLAQRHQKLLGLRKSVLERIHQEIVVPEQTPTTTGRNEALTTLGQGLESQLQRLLSDEHSRERIRRVFQARRKGSEPVVNRGVAQAGNSGRYDPEHFDDAELFHRIMQQRIAENDWDKSSLPAERSKGTMASLIHNEHLDPTTALIIERAKHRLRKYAAEERHASKGRRLVYTVHDRLVGFMAPRPLPQVRPLPGAMPMET